MSTTIADEEDTSDWLTEAVRAALEESCSRCLDDAADRAFVTRVVVAAVLEAQEEAVARK